MEDRMVYQPKVDPIAGIEQQLDFRPDPNQRRL
jgi:hypothetical protein